jgi:hypothetical protein
MGDKLVIQKKTASVILVLGFIAMIGFIPGCADIPVTPPAAPQLPESHWGDNYSYNYDPPKKVSPASVQATIIVVNPFYKDAESSMVDPIYAQVGKGFSRSMGVDLDKIIVAKGMTSVGPYMTLDDVTWPDKKNADITLAPRVFLTTDTKYDEWQQIQYSKNASQNPGGEPYFERNFEMKIGGWVAYEMREPLSSEKMWVKKLELDGNVVRGKEIYEATPVYETRYGGQYGNEPYQALVRYDHGKIVYNGRAEALGDVLKNYYPVIMAKAWTYLDTDEILNLKGKAKEIRELKRY